MTLLVRIFNTQLKRKRKLPNKLFFKSLQNRKLMILMICWMNLIPQQIRKKPRKWSRPLRKSNGKEGMRSLISMWSQLDLLHPSLSIKVRSKHDYFRKCYPCCIAGEDVLSGKCESSMNLWVCDKLLCLDCSHNVVRLSGKQWKKEADYLFFRNYIKIPAKLETMSVVKKGSCAYACQCKWASTSEWIDMPSGEINWVCSSH